MNDYHPLSLEYIGQFRLSHEASACLKASLMELRTLRLSIRYEQYSAEVVCRITSSLDVHSLSIAFGEARGFVKGLSIIKPFKTYECDPLLRIFVNAVEKMHNLLDGV
ncbi:MULTISPECIES: hypothetical protein [unclassified Pseudomonas]|uniref:hypothetical protein n=1 Tax=unclassified Pseudomonas TaxID=196821 RepID=UPI00111C7747|nr:MULTISPECIES: hypothetical protein [unclassified Pseudomonas]